ncbi:MAG TPA: hypothetical protein VLI68_13350 [Hanamia sp.]|jgi:hypothetical protein|nr:hypothetical protein [Hanamia sp.]
MKKLFAKCTLLLLLAGFAIISSSFKNETVQNSSKKENIMKQSVQFNGKMKLNISNGINGTGEASHIGSFTLSAQDDETNFPFITGTVVITAANGDQVFATHTGFAMELGNNMLQVDFDNTITGGTGRFEEASGSFEIHAMVNETLSTGNATLDGNISY